MERIQILLMGISILLMGLFITLYSKRLAHVLIESTKLMGEGFGIKRNFSRNFEFCIQIVLAVFGVAIILTAARVFREMFK